MLSKRTKLILDKFDTLEKPNVLFDRLSLEDIALMVDDGVLADTIKKDSDKETERIKGFILAYAKYKKSKLFAGVSGVATIGKKSSSFIAPKDLLEYLTRADKRKLFFDLIKVGISDAKKYLGEASLKGILKVTEEAYGSVSFKKNKA